MSIRRFANLLTHLKQLECVALGFVEILNVVQQKNLACVDIANMSVEIQQVFDFVHHMGEETEAR